MKNIFTAKSNRATIGAVQNKTGGKAAARRKIMLETIKKIVLDASVLMKDNRFEVKTKDSPVNLVTDMDVAVEKFCPFFR